MQSDASTPQFCLISLSRSWVDIAIWFGHWTCSIQHCQSSVCFVAQRLASSTGTDQTNTVRWTVGLCRPAILWLTLRTTCQLIPHLHYSCTHSKTHQTWNTNTVSASGMWRRGRLIFMVTEVDCTAYETMGSWEHTAILICIWGLSCQGN